MASIVAPSQRPVGRAAPAEIFRRRAYALDRIPVEDSTLAQAHALWSRQRNCGLLPAYRDIDVAGIGLLVDAVHLVDTSATSAEQYLCRFDVAAPAPMPPSDIADLRLADVKPAAYRQAVMEDYRTVVLTGVPAFHHVAGRLDGASHDYSRLILPLADSGRRVTSLVVCTNTRVFEDFSI
jgi:hypothetical protein